MEARMFKPKTMRIRCTAITVLAGLVMFGAATIAGAQTDWLALCSKCVNPTIFSKSGIGTARAMAEARITRAEVQGWCANWQPDDKNCVKDQLAAEDLNKVYRATADCTAGRITPIDGKTYTLAGVWDNRDIGAGRSKWRDAAGKMVGRDNASGGLGISQQWEVLCPTSGKGAKAASAQPGHAQASRAAGAARQATQSLPAAEFAVGQIVQARYGREWIRARVIQVRQVDGPRGPEIRYDVSLENGKRGVVPARMLRAP
jgi:hypothetical protein